MGIIRERLFKLKEISAISIKDKFENSQNEPFFIKGVDQNTGKSDHYVLKPTIGSRMYAGASMRELIASLIAIELELIVPEPVIVNISLELAELYKNHKFYKILSSNIGKNFGTLYLEDNTTWLDSYYQNKLFFPTIQSIFIFDVFIDNTDRNNTKPNVLVKDDKIHMIDHEIAFSFAHLILYDNPTPWLLTENDCALSRLHLFYNFLKGGIFCSENLIKKMANLDVEFWNAVEFYLPNDWKHEKYITIRNYLLNRITRLDLFQKEIERLLM